MRILSVNVGRPRQIHAGEGVVTTSIFKTPVDGVVRVGPTSLAGDEQSDRTVHGGVRKSVYVYPSEHYAFWRAELPDVELPWGAFGENLTTEGIHEETTFIGDTLRIGSAEFVVTQPRQPCHKLALRLQRPEIIKKFFQSGRSGFYLSVAREGDISAGDMIEVVRVASPTMTIAAAAAQIRDKQV
jgi:MOSC domain-containing protein YiiM